MHPISNPQPSPENSHFPTTNIPLDPIPVAVPFIFLVLGLSCIAPLPLTVASPFIVGDALPFLLSGELLTMLFLRLRLPSVAEASPSSWTMTTSSCFFGAVDWDGGAIYVPERRSPAISDVKMGSYRRWRTVERNWLWFRKFGGGRHDRPSCCWTRTGRDPTESSTHNDHQLNVSSIGKNKLPVFMVAKVKKNIVSLNVNPATFIATAEPSVSKINPSRGWLYRAPKAYGTYNRWCLECRWR